MKEVIAYSMAVNQLMILVIHEIFNQVILQVNQRLIGVISLRKHSPAYFHLAVEV